jgi:DNA polymerase-3 subunit epsilon
MESYSWAIEAYRDGAVFTAFDIETTGLDPKEDRIVEIGALKFDKRGPAARFSVLINPGIPMNEAAEKVNNISDAMLAGKPSLEEILPDFLMFTGDTVIIAHNAAFDCGFVNEALKRLYEKASAQRGKIEPSQGDLLLSFGDAAPESPSWTPPFPCLPNRIADTLVMARAAFPGRPGYSLQALASGLGISATEAHRAEDDARVCMEIFLRIAGQTA